MAFALFAAAWPVAHAQEEPAVVRRATELREAPGESGRSVAPLPADTAVTRLGDRQGPWIKVRTGAGAAGWVHLFDIGPAGGGGNLASNALRSVTSLFSRPAAQRTTTSTSTIGIRGLGAEDLAQAQPDAAAVARMEALRLGEPQARQFARDAALKAVAVDPLPEPSRAPAAAHQGQQP
ncbi:MAG TPA: SH3 domain-containing protein [Ramlibacter sp.]|jgi:hypothetical protein|uniref:SH3 domain-containing protein n=1 Tax=Ramlibacter sp. TaxID=1917967 RepID=UPI002D5960C5|nr:SH3 domain-containing protein [Ramlibacter sp.]HZY17445.1 SH3 domain-containing protein [Ramlibacter sp.]